MRNLYRISHSRTSLSRSFDTVRAFTIGQTKSEQIFFSTNEGLHRYYGSSFHSNMDSSRIESTEVETLLPSEAGYREIIAIEHLVPTNELCCASSDGSVWSYKLDTGVAEEVTHCEHGIETMQWSPDQEVVVFVDKMLNVVTMIGSEYEPINEVQLKDDTFGDRAFMSVGWGKKETQFHGSEGKAAAKRTKQDGEKHENSDIHFEESAPCNCISWRADGELFAVSFQAPCGQRAFKVFNKEGSLQYTSERCEGLQSVLAWRPSGQWIAVPQILAADKYVITLFEKNGLRHREIPIPLILSDGHEVLSLQWSPDSEVLAVFWNEKAKLSQHVYLYVMGNYHWYLKQCLQYPAGVCMHGIQWDQRHSAGKTLHLLSSGDLLYERVRFDFRVDRSVGHGEDDEAMVAVIDGNRLCLSTFRRSVIPPPMCSYTVTLQEGSISSINAVGFIRSPGKWSSSGQNLSPNSFFVVDSRNQITFYDITFVEHGAAGKPDSKRRIVLTGVKTLLTIDPSYTVLNDYHTQAHWLWLNPDHLVFSCNEQLFALCVQNDEKCKAHRFTLVKCERDENESIGCIESSGPGSVFVELSSGRLMEVDGFRIKNDNASDRMTASSQTVQLHSVLPSFCEHIFIDHERPGRTVYAFAQNRRHLYRNGTLLASEVTSVLPTEAYLLFTTVAELKFVRLGDTAGHTIVGDRRLERGSKLVTVVPRASRTIFQMPRGNLEAINPRVLSLCIIANHLEALEYHKAFEIIRKERINLNLLVDHDAERFLAHLGTHFLPQITNVNWLNLFITDLANEDVCKTMYASNYPLREVQSPPIVGYTVGEKVQVVCERLLEVMDTEPTVLSLSKITCHVKQMHLDCALALIWTLKCANPSPEPAEDALRYLLYLVEVDVLYNVALGMYDFGLVLFVATKSQKDPKEYLPFLNELKRLDEHYRKYRIDCHLKRYDRALSHIARYEADDERFQEALELIVTHGLYTIGLECYRCCTNEAYYRKVCERYGDHLRKGGKHAEASLMYERAGDFQQAISSARHALDWRRVLRLGARLTDPDAVRPMLRSLVPGLVEAGEHDAAATIAHEHLKDVRLAVDCLLKDQRYERALFLLASGESDEPDLHETVRDHLCHYLTTFGATLASEKAQFLHQKGRLAVVRQKREKAQLATAEGGDADAEGDCGECDLFSDSSTIASSRHTSSTGRSGKSHRSSKNRRKHERKLLNLKEGNPFEDLALIDALHALVLRVCSVERQRHVRSICQVAMEFDFDAEARTIQREYGALFQLVRYSLDTVWIPEMIVPSLPSSAPGDAAAPGDSKSSFEQPSLAINTHADLLQAQNAQRYGLIKQHQRYKPDIQLISWQWDILK